jgi:hypothetical protein
MKETRTERPISVALWSRCPPVELVGDGRLSLDDTIEDVLPGALPYGRRITVRDLLNHSSGLDDGHVPEASPRKVLEPIAETSPLSRPGSAHSYANVNPASDPPPPKRSRQRRGSGIRKGGRRAWPQPEGSFPPLRTCRRSSTRSSTAISSVRISSRR